MRNACLTLCCTVATCSLAGLLFLSLHGDTPCLFHRYFAVSCPGCGTTRAMRAFLSGQFYEGVHHNPGLFIIVPLSVFTVYSTRWKQVFSSKAAIGLALITVLYTVVRNWS